MRSVIALFLLGLAACDRGAEEAPQANVAKAAAPAEVELAGKLDMANRGDRPPTVAFQDSEQNPVRIADFHGTPVLVNLWATWCGPCVRELPSLDRLALKTAGRLKIVAVNQDNPETSDPYSYWAERNFAMLQLFTDPKTALTAAYASGVLPTTILYDAKGREVWRIVGGLEWDGPRANTLLSPIIGDAVAVPPQPAAKS